MLKDEFEYIKLDGVEMDEMVLYNGRLFFTIGDDVYAEDFILNIVLRYNVATNEWDEVTEDLSDKEKHDYNFKEAVKAFDDNPPWPYFDKVLYKREEINKDNFITINKNISKRVIGWMPFNELFKARQDDTDEGFMAVVNDIVAHGWRCTGMEFDNSMLVAILNTHEFVSLSTRGWGAAMGAADGAFGQMDYARYAFGFSDEVFDDDPVFPEPGFYEEFSFKKEVEVPVEVINNMYKYESYAMLEKYEVNNIYYFVPDSYVDKVYYDIMSPVYFVNGKEDIYPAPIEEIYYFENYENFKSFLDEEREDEESLILCDEELVNERLKNGPIYLIKVLII